MHVTDRVASEGAARRDGRSWSVLPPTRTEGRRWTVRDPRPASGSQVSITTAATTPIATMPVRSTGAGSDRPILDPT